MINFKKFDFKKKVKWLLRHKIILSLIIIVVISAVFLVVKAASKGDGGVQYVTAAVEKGTITVSVSGTGQVSASNQVDIKSTVSGDVTYLNIKKGQEVKNNEIIAQIDSIDAQVAVRDAKTALETAELELSELLTPADELDMLKAENNLAQANETKEKAEDAIIEAYEDAFNDVADAFLDLPTTITKLRNVLYSYEIAEAKGAGTTRQWNLAMYLNSFELDDRDALEDFVEQVESVYDKAREAYDDNFENYKNTSRYSDDEEKEALLNETVETAKLISDTIKSETNLLDFIMDYLAEHTYDQTIYNQIAEYQSDLSSLTSKTNSHLSSLLSTQRSMRDTKEDLLNAERSIQELELSLADLKAGADDLDIRSKTIAVQQKQDALYEAQQNLADYYIRAPFDGVIAETEINKGESISSGTTIATIITDQKIAEITLNEVDASLIGVGQKAILEFDAIEGLSITGQVVEVDILGTVTQGVVSYDVKVSFDIQDNRVKSGMSVSVIVITESKQNVLLVSSGAIKTQGETNYVEVLNNGQLETRVVTIGLVSDTTTEIIEGLEEGEEILIQAINSSDQTSSQTQGMNGGGMNMMRF